MGNPKPTKIWGDHIPRTNALILKLTTATVARSAQGGAICCISLGDGLFFLPANVPGLNTGSLHPLPTTR